jgi:hypothetical protein
MPGHASTTGVVKRRKAGKPERPKGEGARKEKTGSCGPRNDKVGGASCSPVVWSGAGCSRYFGIDARDSETTARGNVPTFQTPVIARGVAPWQSIQPCHDWSACLSLPHSASKGVAQDRSSVPAEPACGLPRACGPRNDALGRGRKNKGKCVRNRDNETGKTRKTERGGKAKRKESGVFQTPESLLRYL